MQPSREAPLSAAANAAGAKFTASNWRHIGKNTLVGSADVETPEGLIFRALLLHERSGKRWVQIPSREYVKADGQKAFYPTIEFTSPDRFYAFNAAALEAIDALFGEESGR